MFGACDKSSHRAGVLHSGEAREPAGTQTDEGARTFRSVERKQGKKTITRFITKIDYSQI